MKFIAKACTSLIILFSSPIVNAQKIIIKEGNPYILKGVTEINIEFSYDNLRVGKYNTEKEYVDKKIAEYNKEDSGKGDIWAKAWSYDKESKYHPQFIESFFGNSGMKISKEAKYTLIFKTTYIDPGALKSSIDADVWIVETSGKLNKLAVLSVSGATGYKGWETSYRISQAYAQSGKKLALFIFNK